MGCHQEFSGRRTEGFLCEDESVAGLWAFVAERRGLSSIMSSSGRAHGGEAGSARERAVSCWGV